MMCGSYTEMANSAHCCFHREIGSARCTDNSDVVCGSYIEMANSAQFSPCKLIDSAQCTKYSDAACVVRHVMPDENRVGASK